MFSWIVIKHVLEIDFFKNIASPGCDSFKPFQTLDSEVGPDMFIPGSAVWNTLQTHRLHMTLPVLNVPCWPLLLCVLFFFFLQSSMPAIMTMLADHAAQQLLDFNQKLDINLLDNVVNCLYHGVGPQVRVWNPRKFTALSPVEASLFPLKVQFVRGDQTLVLPENTRLCPFPCEPWCSLIEVRRIV